MNILEWIAQPKKRVCGGQGVTGLEALPGSPQTHLLLLTGPALERHVQNTT